MKEAPLSDENIETFMRQALSKAGAEEMITPREIIRDYLTLLNILKDNKGASFDQLIKSSVISVNEREENTQKEEATASVRPKISLFDLDI